MTPNGPLIGPANSFRCSGGGLSLMEALRDAGSHAAICVARSLAPPATSTSRIAGPHRSHQDEIELLEESENFRPESSRLSCQIRLDELPPKPQWSRSHRKKSET